MPALTYADLVKHRPPMTGNDAERNIATMTRVTRDVNARVKVVEMALGRFGNLGPEARAVYEAALRDTKFTGRLAS